MSAIRQRAWLLLFWLAGLFSACAGGRESVTVPALAGKFPHYADEAVRVDKAGVKIEDGDTFEAGGQQIRVLGLDAPEIAHPRMGWREGQPYGEAARKRAGDLFAAARVIEYLPYEKDRYGRLLAHVFLDGRLFAAAMIEEHLGWETIGTYGDNGFPDLAELILKAAGRAGDPPFMEPYRWRRLQREKSGASRR